MWTRRLVGSCAAVLLVGACSAAPGPGPADADAAWMDGAVVVVDGGPCAGVETVTLVDAASGQREVVSSESFAPDPVACGQASPRQGPAAAPVTAGHVLAVGASL